MNESNAPTVVACFGTSTTAGKGQAFNWIGELEKRPENAKFRFYNFGVGGDLSYNVLARLSSVVACHPDRVIVLVGGNDVLATVFKKIRELISGWKKLPHAPSPRWFRENLQTIVQRLKKETSARIALISIQQIGEDSKSTNPAQHELNVLIEQYNGVIKEIAQAESVDYIPLYERLHEQIEVSPRRAFTAFRFLPFYRDTFRYCILRESSDEIAKKNGWQFHVDGIHLNKRGGMILAELVQKFLDS